MNSKIHIIRHGITEGNKKNWYYGALDLPLHEEGIDSIVRMAQSGLYPSIDDGAFFSSGLVRTEQTLFLIYGQVNHRALPELQEMRFGIFEGKTYEEIKEHADFQKWIEDENHPFPDGESKQDFFVRVEKGLSKLIALHQVEELKHRHNKKDTDTLVVCHGGVISRIMSICFPNSGKTFFDWIPAPGMGYTLNCKEGRVVSYDQIQHKE